MKMQAETLAAIEEYLESVPRHAYERGHKYWSQGRVSNLVSIMDGSCYTASVRGGDRYNVSLMFTNKVWDGECSCPIGFDCKHIVAAFFELQAQASAESSFVSSPARVQQPPRSPLSEKLMDTLGRKLVAQEVQFVRAVQSLYAETRYRKIQERDLASLAMRTDQFYAWQAVELWPVFPQNDYDFWLYVAWEWRKRNWPIPEFMHAITDLSVIEADMARWQRQREIEQWTIRFRDAENSRPRLDSGPLDLRLALFAEQARLQFRQTAGGEFADFKKTHAKRFAEEFERGELLIGHESLPLWSAAYKPGLYESWWSFDYENQTALRALNRLLRLPVAPDRIVTANGQPLVRHAERLRLDIRSPETPDGDYDLRLVKADGAAPPRFHCTLDGEPTLYLTNEGLFEGPRADALESGVEQKIPAGALETAAGTRFLMARGVALPERLQARVRTVPVRVTIECSLAPIYPGSPSEDIHICVRAEASEMQVEQLTADGWQTDRFARPNEKPASENDEKIVIHDRSAQHDLRPSLQALDAKWSGYPSAWHVRVTKKTPELFLGWLKSLPANIEVLLDKQLATLRNEPVSGVVSLDVEEAGIDWFDLKVALNVTDTKLTPEELKLLLNARGGYARLGKKGWRRLQFNLTPEEDEQLARLGLNPRDLSAEPQRFHALQLADDGAKRFLAPERVEKIQRRVSELKARVSPPLPAELRVEMRPYQTEGFHFLAYLSSNRFGGVLADDMGLGKTIQTLAWLAWLRSQTPAPTASLVVCPKSVMDNWRAEAQRFYSELRVRLWRGEAPAELASARESCDLIVINYSQLRSLTPEITNARWLAAILDEAQYIKNPDSQTAQAARALQADHRLALTGTPIENRLLDLWSILAYAMPGALGNRAQFQRRFDAKDDPLARRRLAARVRPFLLRRTKNQVAKDLPDRVEEDLLCELEGAQKTLYRAELKRARQILLGLKTNKQLNEERFTILTSLLRLRQICCHPALVDPKLHDTESAKVAALEDLLEPLVEEGHKTLVFSQFVTMLDLLRERAKARGWRHFYLAGDTENRGELVQEFQSTSGGAVFFISLKAGGFGLNLTAASYVVLFDPWWNPAVENQAIDRTHRIGQTSKVMAYRLLMRDSIEEKIRALQKQKSALAQNVLGEERFAQSLTLDDLKFLFAD